MLQLVEILLAQIETIGHRLGVVEAGAVDTYVDWGGMCFLRRPGGNPGSAA